MNLQFIPVPGLPRLAWCAELSANSPVVRVWHGPWVETRGNWFVEGAWNGDFDAGGFPDASSFAGTGGRAANGGMVFAASTDLFSRLHVLRTGGRLLVSNSIVFCFVQAGDRPDPGYQRYYHDFVLHNRAGASGRPTVLPTAAGSELWLCDFCNVVVDPSLAVTLAPKNAASEPATYDDYRKMLDDTVASVLANAAHPSRRRRYAAISELSSGYDSTAAAVVGAGAGCTRSLSVVDERAQPGQDSGAATARQLGFVHRDFPRLGFRELPGMPEAEFAVGPLGQHVVMAPQAGLLEGAIMLSGRNGDDVWSLKSTPPPRVFQRPGATTISGGSTNEFRLRVGYLHLPIPCIGIQHAQCLHRLAASPDLQPWSVGGDYDRPVARRIAEEGGIRRGTFAVGGKQKYPSLHLRHPGDLLAASREDNARFRAALRARTRWTARARHALACAGWRLEAAVRRMVKAGVPKLFGEHYAPRYQDPLRLFHWGVETLRQRYQCAGTLADDTTPFPR